MSRTKPEATIGGTGLPTVRCLRILTGAATLLVLSLIAVPPTEAGDPGRRCWYLRTTIVGTPGERLHSPRRFPGEDVYAMLGGADRVVGGRGYDFVCGDLGPDTLIGQGDEDVLRGAADDDTLLGESGTDYLYGGPGADYLDGGNDRDRSYCGSGNDTIVALHGHDALIGKEGDERLDAADGVGDDYLNGGRGFDRCRFDEGDYVVKDHCEIEDVS